MWAFPWSQKTCIHFKYLVIIGYSQGRCHPPWGEGRWMGSRTHAPPDAQILEKQRAVTPQSACQAVGPLGNPTSLEVPHQLPESKTLSPLWSQAIWVRESEETGNQLLLSAHLLGVTATPSPNPNLTLECQTGSGRWALPVLQRPLEVVCSNGNSQPFLLLLP